MAYSLDHYNLCWTSCGRNSSDSMPVGNGDIGLNVWVEEGGDLLFYIGKTDAWDEYARLLKLGRVRVQLDPNPFLAGNPFRQTLRMIDGAIEIVAGEDSHGVRIRIWTDANQPVANVEVESDDVLRCSVALEVWRSHSRPMRSDGFGWQSDGVPDASFSEAGLFQAGLNPRVEPDTILDNGTQPYIRWYHRNETSIFKGECEHQGLGEYAEHATDPLLHRTSGGVIWCSGEFAPIDDRTLVSTSPLRRFSLHSGMLCGVYEDVQAWVRDVESIAEAYGQEELAVRFEKHRQWWASFWDRSHVEVSGRDVDETQALSQGWHLHRYTVASAGRGNFPMKFNGSIFNMDGNRGETDENRIQGYDADYRCWGGSYWHQNQRQIYWPMLAAGDFDCLTPFFRMYLDDLPYAEAMTRAWFGHDGAFFPETMHFWGGYDRVDYGMTPSSARSRDTVGEVESGYIKRHWQGGLELVWMMLETYDHAGDSCFLEELVLPIARAVITFYDLHYPRDEDAKIRIEPAQALETLWDVVDPVPEIAGLCSILEKLTAMPEGIIPCKFREQCLRLRSELPSLTLGMQNGVECLMPCREDRGETRNCENAALYAIFPYRRFGVDKPELETLRNTYAMRPFKGDWLCWHNDNVYAAYLGLCQEARWNLAKRFVWHDGYRFPAFYTGGDWIPDHQNGGVAQQALQGMLMQCDGDKILLFPAWPKEWDVDFKLHAAKSTVVEGCLMDGRLIRLHVMPEERRGDIQVLKLQ